MGANLSTWLGFLWNYKTEIDWRFGFKIFAITFMIMLYTPLIWWERLRFDKKIKATEVKNPVFIIGHQRSGTTYLNYLLGKDSQFGLLTVKESFMPWVFLSASKHLERVLVKSLPSKRPMDNLKLGMDLPTEPEYALGNMTNATMLSGYYLPSRIYDAFKRFVLFEKDGDKREWQQTFKYFMQKLTLKNSGKPLLIKAPENLGRVREILEVFPDAKFIHIYRNPYTVYFSTERLYQVTLPMVALEHWRKDVVPDFILKSYPEIFSKYFEDKKLVPKGNLVEIKYEDFIGNEMAVMEDVYRKLGLGGFDAARESIQEEVNDHRNYKTNTYEYPMDKKDEIYEKWKSVFDELGYAQ